MSFSCLRGRKAECDGCGWCSMDLVAGRCCQCHASIYDGEDIYRLDEVMLHEDCMRDYMRQYLCTAQAPEPQDWQTQGQ